MSFRASCHCGATQFEVAVAPTVLTRCNCSFCSKRGSLWAYYPLEQFKLLTPTGNSSIYRWGTCTLDHHFCKTCGCSTFAMVPDYRSGKMDFTQTLACINTRLLEDFDLDAVPVRVIDGLNMTLF